MNIRGENWKAALAARAKRHEFGNACHFAELNSQRNCVSRGSATVVTALICLTLPALPFQHHAAFAADSQRHPRVEVSEIQKMIEGDFELNNPNYPAIKSTYAKRLNFLTVQLIALQRRGRSLACSNQIMVEARWMMNHTTEWIRLADQLSKLARSFQDTDQNFATQQSREDGAWGGCYEEWFLKLDATIDPLNELANQNKPLRHPLVFLRRIADPKSLIAYLDGLLVSDIAETGVDHRNELGAVTGALSQMFFKADVRQLVNQAGQDFVIDDEYVDIYRDFLDSWQDPVTGYWGAWYRSKGKLFKGADLSLTFHAISYRKGRVKYWPLIINTTLSIKDYEYPYGWLHNGRYKHHNNYDVVKILRYGWPHMSEEQKKHARTELINMLDWCLGMPMKSNTLFAIDPTFYSSPANYYYYGVSFLDEIGYWNQSRRFWTNRDFPQARRLCQKIKEKLISLNFDVPLGKAALQKLEANCPSS